MITAARRAAARATTVALERSLSVMPRRPFGAVLATGRALRHADRATEERIDVSRAGRAVLRRVPDTIARLAPRLPHGRVAVSGTNGKTTTTALVAAMLAADGRRPVTNAAGANMAGGIAAELVRASRGRGMAGDSAVFEVDELWLDQLVPELVPDVVVLTNLSRDQLDRMGELDRVAERWRRLVIARPDVHWVLGADDPRVAALGRAAARVSWFGLGQDEGRAGSQPPSLHRVHCCGRPLGYEEVYFAHIGRFRCGACGRSRPVPDVWASGIELGGRSSTFRLHLGEAEETARLPLAGRYNVANALAAATAAMVLGVTPAAISRSLASASPSFGRGERTACGARDVELFLAKNPVGCDAVAEVLRAGAGRDPLDLVFALNAHELDGRDVSWIWDADLEALAPAVGTAWCTGDRAAEAAMRLKYAGVPAERLAVVSRPEHAVERAVASGGSAPVAVVANYTAMLDLREWLAERGHAERYWR